VKKFFFAKINFIAKNQSQTLKFTLKKPGINNLEDALCVQALGKNEGAKMNDAFCFS
jgi:hypothetical protein